MGNSCFYAGDARFWSDEMKEEMKKIMKHDSDNGGNE